MNEREVKIINLERDSLDLFAQTMLLFEKLKPILADQSGLSFSAVDLTDSLNRSRFNINYSAETIRHINKFLIPEKLK
jgi:hypothetical protein